MLIFEHGDGIKTTLGAGLFQRYSNNGQSYQILFTDGKLNGQIISVGPAAILSEGRHSQNRVKTESAYHPYEGNESIFDAPINFEKNADLISRFLKQSSSWVLIVSASPNSLDSAITELSAAGLDNASDYVRKSGAQTHGIKYDLLIPDPKIKDLDLQLGIYFNPVRLQSTGMYQIGRKEFALHVLPYVRVLEIGEII